MQFCDNVGSNFGFKIGPLASGAILHVDLSCRWTACAGGDGGTVPSNMDIADRLYVASQAWSSTERQQRR